MIIDPPKSSEARSNEDGDWIVRQFVASADLAQSPEEYVAHHAHRLGNFAFHHFEFVDPKLENWVRRVGELLASDQAVARCREQFLRPDELAVALEQEVEDL